MRSSFDESNSIASDSELMFLSCCHFRFCNLSWRQTIRFLTVFLDFDTFLPLGKDQVQVSVSESVLRVSVSEDTPQHTTHTLPCQRLDFFASVKDDSVRVKINQRRVTINLEKTEAQMWERLGMEKWAWVKRNEDSLDEDFQDDDAPYTKEKVKDMRPLPEAAWEDLENSSVDCSSSSELNQSFNEESEVEFVDNDEEAHKEDDIISKVM